MPDSESEVEKEFVDAAPGGELVVNDSEEAMRVLALDVAEVGTGDVEKLPVVVKVVAIADGSEYAQDH